MTDTIPAPVRFEVIGIRSGWWAKDTGRPEVEVIGPAGRFAETGEDPAEFARYLSSGYDCGASAYSTDTGGMTALRDADTREVIAFYVEGERRTTEFVAAYTGATAERCYCGTLIHPAGVVGCISEPPLPHCPAHDAFTSKCAACVAVSDAALDALD